MWWWLFNADRPPPASAHGKPSYQCSHKQAQGSPADDPTTPSTLTSLLEKRLGIWRALYQRTRDPVLDPYLGPRHRATMARTMISVNIDRSEPVALHDQVAAEIRKAIAEGEAAPGERLPLAKDIAAVLGVNKNTVLRAMHILRDEGLLEFRRGRGMTVVGEPERGLVVSRALEFLAFARQQGYRRSDVLKLIQDLP